MPCNLLLLPELRNSYHVAWNVSKCKKWLMSYMGKRESQRGNMLSESLWVILRKEKSRFPIQKVSQWDESFSVRNPDSVIDKYFLPISFKSWRMK